MFMKPAKSNRWILAAKLDDRQDAAIFDEGRVGDFPEPSLTGGVVPAEDIFPDPVCSIVWAAFMQPGQDAGCTQIVLDL